MQSSGKSTLINAIEVRAERHPDGGLVLTIGTRYGGETSYFLSKEVMQPLVSVLSSVSHDGAGAATPALTNGPAKPAVPPPDSEPKQAEKIAVHAPKRWMLGNGLPNRPVVVLIVDPHTERQAGYAFDAKAARELGAGFVKNADVIEARHKPST